jgi:hypothetical protein
MVEAAEWIFKHRKFSNVYVENVENVENVEFWKKMGYIPQTITDQGISFDFFSKKIV